MGGPFMVEIVFCRVTRRGRKKKAGMNKLARENCRNDGPMGGGFIPPDTLKITLDLSDSGPVFSALDEMMMKMMEDDEKARSKGGSDNSEAKNALKKLLKSGIPGIEAMFGGEDPKPRFGKGGGKKGYHKMNEASKKKFMAAIFGEDGTQIDSSTAAALLAACCSSGNPDVGNKLAELLMPDLDEKVDPAMMAALMSACSMIQSGASTEEILTVMKLELAASGLTEEEILHKAELLMKAFGKEDSNSMAEWMLMSKQQNKALIMGGLNPKDFTALVLAHKAIGACGTTAENVAKILMIYSTLGKKSANPAHVAASLKNLGAVSDEVKADCKQKILKAWNSGKFSKPDVQGGVRMHQALENENEPSWMEVKNLKDIVGGVSPTNPEAIELNLARAVKAGGMKKDDIGRALIALKAIAGLGIDPVKLSKMMFLEKTICENGVPASEVARVLNDGLMPIEATQGLIKDVEGKLSEETNAKDVEASMGLYNNLKFKSNIPTDVIEYVDKSLIQVRCSLEDVADNLISSLSARGEKTNRIIAQVTETLKKTGATATVVATTAMPALLELTGEKECPLARKIGQYLKEAEYENDDVKMAVTELILKLIDTDPTVYNEAVRALEDTCKDMGEFTNEITDFIKDNIPSPPTPPEEIARREEVAKELERLQKEEEQRERLAALKISDPAAYEKECKKLGISPSTGKPGLDRLDSLREGGSGSRSESRRGSMGPGQQRSRQGSVTIGGQERRGSYYEKDVTTRATVAMVTDDPEHKAAVKQGLAGAFGESEGGVTVNGGPGAGAAGAGAAGGAAGAGGAGGAAAGGKGAAGAGAAAGAGGTGGKGGAAGGGTGGEAGGAAGAGGAGGAAAGGAGAGGAAAGGAAAGGGRGGVGGGAGPGAVNGVLGGAPGLGNLSPADQELVAKMMAAGMSEEEVKAMLAQSGGKGISPESRALMEQILASGGSPEEMNSRVAALLSGSKLSSTRGRNLGDTGVEAVGYEGTNLSEARERKDGFVMPETVSMLGPGAGGGSVDPKMLKGDGGGSLADRMRMRNSEGIGARGSVKRQSQIMREKKKSRQEEREEEKARKASYYRKVTGLRRAKVPMMVYSCGGFSRCFRVCRFYDVEGPPVGVEYDRAAGNQQPKTQGL